MSSSSAEQSSQQFQEWLREFVLEQDDIDYGEAERLLEAGMEFAQRKLAEQERQEQQEVTHQSIDRIVESTTVLVNEDRFGELRKEYIYSPNVISEGYRLMDDALYLTKDTGEIPYADLDEATKLTLVYGLTYSAISYYFMGRDYYEASGLSRVLTNYAHPETLDAMIDGFSDIPGFENFDETTIQSRRFEDLLARMEEVFPTYDPSLPYELRDRKGKEYLTELESLDWNIKSPEDIVRERLSN